MEAASDGRAPVAPADAVRVAVPPHGPVPGAAGPAVVGVHGRVRPVRITARPPVAPSALVPVVEAPAAVGVAPQRLSGQERQLVPTRGPVGRVPAKRHAVAGLAPS